MALFGSPFTNESRQKRAEKDKKNPDEEINGRERKKHKER